MYLYTSENSVELLSLDPYVPCKTLKYLLEQELPC